MARITQLRSVLVLCVITGCLFSLIIASSLGKQADPRNAVRPLDKSASTLPSPIASVVSSSDPQTSAPSAAVAGSSSKLDAQEADLEETTWKQSIISTASGFKDTAHDLLHSVLSAVSSSGDGEEALEEEDAVDLNVICEDAYKMPGYLYEPADYHSSVYVPLYDDIISTLPDPDYATNLGSVAAKTTEVDPDLIANNKPDAEIVKQAPHSWMLDLVRQSTLLRKLQDTPAAMTTTDNSTLQSLNWRLQWLRHKRMLLIADSVDRYMIMYFCEELGFEMQLGNRKHTTAFCNVPYLNFTLYHWHLASYTSYRPLWWWQPGMKYVTFEDRYNKLFKSTLPDVIGQDGVAPDLIMYQSGLWDQVTLGKHRKQHDPAIGVEEAVARSLTWPELRYFLARQRQFITHLRGIFGQDSRIMYRALTVHREEGEQDLMLYDMDRTSRALAHAEDIEVFDWARVVTGHTGVFKDRVHVRKGVMSWLYLNTLISYLFRASGGVESRGLMIRYPKDYNATEMGDAWQECHAYNMYGMPENR